MKIYFLSIVVLAAASNCLAQTGYSPAIVTKSQMEGSIFEHEEAEASVYNKRTEVIDYVSLASTDEKFVTGVYSSGPIHESYPKGYGMDEFWVLLSGSITLTADDGTVITYKPGDSCSIPSEWKGRWDSEGYTKAYAVYARDGKWPTGGKLEKD